jgi:hypothetical protein
MLIIDVPSLTLVVICDNAPRVVKASRPHDSGIHNESIFCLSSANFANVSTSLMASKVPRLYAILENFI